MISGRLSYLRFTGSPNFGVINLTIDSESGNGTVSIFEYFLFENITPLVAADGSAITGSLNEGIVNIIDTRFNNVESGNNGAGSKVSNGSRIN